MELRCRADICTELTRDQQSVFVGYSSKEMLKDIGWFDLHYPYYGNRKAMIRICLPVEYHSQVSALADAGNGDQFAFVVLDGEVRRDDIFVWNHEDDSRSWVAPRLEAFYEWWLIGRIEL